MRHHLFLFASLCFFRGGTCKATLDFLTSGNYVISNCEEVGRSQDLLNLLPQVWEALRLVLSDLEHGTASQHGFRAFFKSNANIPVVKEVFRSIEDGRNLRTTKPVVECLHPSPEPQKQAVYEMVCLGQSIVAAALPGHG